MFFLKKNNWSYKLALNYSVFSAINIVKHCPIVHYSLFIENLLFQINNRNSRSAELDMFVVEMFDAGQGAQVVAN